MRRTYVWGVRSGNGAFGAVNMGVSANLAI